MHREKRFGLARRGEPRVGLGEDERILVVVEDSRIPVVIVEGSHAAEQQAMADEVVALPPPRPIRAVDMIIAEINKS